MLPPILGSRRKLTSGQRVALRDTLVRWREERAKAYSVPYFFHVLDENEVFTIDGTRIGISLLLYRFAAL